MLASPLCSEKIFSTYTYWLFTLLLLLGTQQGALDH